MPRYPLKIKTLSPIHIGDGKFYDGMTSFEYQGKLIPLDFPDLVRALEASEIPKEEFTQWVAESKQEREYRKPRINDFIKFMYSEQLSSFARNLSQANRGSLENLSATRINSDIATCMKNAYKMPYIAGSSMKGAIETALLYSCLKKDSEFKNRLASILEKNYTFLSEVYESMVNIKKLVERKKELGFQNYKKIGIPREHQRDFRRILTMRERRIGDIRRDLQNKMGFRGRRLEEICDLIEEWREGDKRELNQRIRQERMKYDFQKIFLIAKQIHNLEEEFKNRVFALPTDKKQKITRFLKISDMASNKPSKITNCLIIHQNPRITMDLFFEIIDSEVDFDSTLEIGADELIMSELGFPEKCQQLLGKKALLRAIYEFSERVIQEEIAYFDKLKGYNYRFPINEIKSQLYQLQKQNRPDAPILRLGKGQGFHSLTIALLIKDYNSEIYQKYLEITELDRQIYNKLLGPVQSNKNNPENYPITRRIFTDGSRKYKLPGWLKLDIGEEIS